MSRQRVGAAIAAVGVMYLVAVSWMSSWLYVPAVLELGPRALAERTPFFGTVFSIVWGVSGVVGPLLVALGAALYAGIGRQRLLYLGAGAAALVLWLVFWRASLQHGIVFGVGGGLILLFFLASCLDWARTRHRIEGHLRTAADFRLAANASFFMGAWGLCGLLGAPVNLLHPEPSSATSAGASLAVKVLMCLVLGWGFTAIAQRIERRKREREAGERLSMAVAANC